VTGGQSRKKLKTPSETNKQTNKQANKRLKAKGLGSMAQDVECLPRKLEALSSIPSTGEKKNPR
jgi:hypothetical protein